MDPLSIGAGIIGILGVAAHVSHVLKEFTSSVKNVPHQAQVILNEVSDMSGILSYLQRYFDEEELAEEWRMSMLKVDQIVNIIGSCVITFSELVELLDELKPDEMSIRDRIKWTIKEPKIVNLIERLQNHKASLSLMLNILNGKSNAEANRSVNRLATQIKDQYQEMSFRIQVLERLALDKEQGLVPEGDASSVHTVTAGNLDNHKSRSKLQDVTVSVSEISTEASNAREPTPNASDFGADNFTRDLQNSWVYKRNQAFRESGFSLLTRSTLADHWSCLSGLSMGEVSTLSVINLPIMEMEVFNIHRYLKIQPDQNLNLTRPFQNSAKSQHLFNPFSSRNVVASYPCENCGQDFKKEEFFELAGRRWHKDCTQCILCRKHLNGSEPNLTTCDKSIICNDCKYCKACGADPNDVFIVIIGQSFYKECLKCRCQNRIGSLDREKTSIKFFKA